MNLRNANLCSTFALLVLAPTINALTAAEPGGRRPFFEAREHVAEYAGPGREKSAPERVDEVRIGYFGPNDPDDPLAGDLWKAAQLAIDQANRQGGYRDKPFQLIPAWSENPWGNGVKLVTRLVYEKEVWAIVGGIDGDTTHLAEQVVAKARLPLVSPIATDKTVNLANVPWVFSVAPGDHLLASMLAAEIAARIGKGRLVLVSAIDHDSRMLTAELRKALAHHDAGLQYEHKLGRDDRETRQLAGQVIADKPTIVIIIAGTDDSARMVVSLRDNGFTGTIFGGPAMGRRKFLANAGQASDGVIFPLLWKPGQTSGGFPDAFNRRYGHVPDYAAAHTYDAVRLLVAAINKAGLTRARIRDAIRELSPWTGATGEVRWDGPGSNTRPVFPGTLANGRAARLTSSRSPRHAPAHSNAPQP